jgi:HAD superfamily hydrolase (TIGR01662 family)
VSALANVLAEHEHILLDFDGPVCSVFAGLSDRTVANHLRERLDPNLPQDVAEADDPFVVLRYARHLGGSAAATIEREFRDQELAAVTSARETPGSADAIQTLVTKGHTVTIVSNNSVDAISRYLREHKLDRLITRISARQLTHATPLKPNPFLLVQAIEHLGTAAVHCCMIGDSVADIDAAKSIGAAVIAYANKPDKFSRFTARQPHAIISDMTEVSHALRR